MTTEELIIIAVRILGSLPVLRWPLIGSIFAIAMDNSDLFIRGWLDLGGVSNYQELDKRLDLVFIGAFMLSAMRWRGVERSIGIVLFILRIVGYVVFEITDERLTLLFFPNTFSYWFVAVAARRHFFGGSEPTRLTVVGIFAICVALSMTHEWILHGGQYLENYSATQLVEEWWGWIFSRAQEVFMFS